ncbi:MAG: hypothetical protein AB1633_04290 [Elusimicrobiota bacterium]
MVINESSCLEKLNTLEKKINQMAKKIKDLTTENETLKAELEFHEKNTAKTKNIYPIEEHLKIKKRVVTQIETLLEKFSKAGI